MSIKFRNILLNTWFLAIPISIIIFIFLPNIFTKYEIRIIDSGKLTGEKDLRVYYHDVDYDGNSERIHSYNYFGNHSLQVYYNDGGMIDQWNTHGEIVGVDDRLTFGDFDKDGFDEIYTFFQKSDTIKLFVFEPIDSISPIAYTKNICALTRKYNEPDACIYYPKIQDINSDGCEELTFAIFSGQARIPRNIFMYDIYNDTVLKSQDFGSTADNEMRYIDFNNDGKIEIICGTYAAGNILDSLGYKYSDYNAWLMVYDHNLSLIFEPIQFPGFLSIIDAYPTILEGKPIIIAYYNHIGSSDNFPKLFFVDNKGEVVKELNFPKSSKIRRRLLLSKPENKNEYNIICEDGKVFTYNSDFDLIDETDLEIEVNVYHCPYQFDLNNDGSFEWIFATKDNNLLIADHKFKYPVLLNHSVEVQYLKISIIRKKNAKPSLFLYDDNNYLIIQYDKNPLYPLRFLIYLGIILIIWFFILLIRKLQLIQIKKQERIRKQIVDLQLKSFRNQMDPHFTFNVFTAMAHKIMKENPSSYEAFMKFSNLIRSTLEASDSITRSVEQELGYLENYLYFEKLRFPDKLDYKIRVSNGINKEMQIPKMILQTFVENAIKHGIRHKEKDGLVKISIRKKNPVLEIEICDNGIGREKAKQLSTDSTGFGLKIMDNYFQLFNKYNETKIKYDIIDLYDKQNNPTGTKVKIFIPLKFSYKLRKYE